MLDPISADIAAVAEIEAISTILEVVCRTTGMGFAAVARVTESRWIACASRDEIDFNMARGREPPLQTTICHDVRQSSAPIIIDHVDVDNAYRDHPAPKLYGFQSYISMPIVLPSGEFFGTLCAFDPAPRKIDNPGTVGMFKLFAEMIAYQLDAHSKLATSDALLLDERATAKLREQFIAVLGHDLRNPLASIQAGLRIIERDQLSERASSVTLMMKKSIQRMAGLVDNVLDFARGRLGGGLALNLRSEDVAPIIQQVIDELASAWKEREIVVQLDVAETVECDRSRLGQLVSNLVGNALTHGSSAGPVEVAARTADGLFTLAVSNPGSPIPEAALPHLFQPFARGEVLQYKDGLGLGLYIASEIAHAHNGKLIVISDNNETRFTFDMPLSQA